MKFSSRLSNVRFETIRGYVVQYQLYKVRLQIAILRIILLFLISYYVFKFFGTEFNFKYTIYIFLIILIFITITKKGQVTIGKYRVRRVMSKYSAGEVVINYEVVSNTIHKNVVIGKNNLNSVINLDKIYNCKVDTENNLIIFSNSKKVNNFKKNKLKYITLDGLSEVDKTKVISFVNKKRIL